MKPFSMPIRDKSEPRRANIRLLRSWNLPDWVFATSPRRYVASRFSLRPFLVALPQPRCVAASSPLESSASPSSRKRNPDPLITDQCPTDNSLQTCSVHTLFTLHSHCSRYFLRGEGASMLSLSRYAPVSPVHFKHTNDTPKTHEEITKTPTKSPKHTKIIFSPPKSLPRPYIATLPVAPLSSIRGPLPRIPRSRFALRTSIAGNKLVAGSGSQFRGSPAFRSAFEPRTFPSFLSRSFRFFPAPLPPGRTSVGPLFPGAKVNSRKKSEAVGNPNFAGNFVANFVEFRATRGPKAFFVVLVPSVENA